PKLQADLKVPFLFKGNQLDEDTPLHKTVREATVNMLANADFYGRRGVVVLKGADGFRFANPGSMRVSLTEAIQDSASDPRNGVMMKMLAMVKYGERAGSGLQGIFKTWQSVFHCAPKLEVTTSGGIDRTTLILGFEGHKPDIKAMKLLYDNPDELIEVDSTQENRQKVGENLGESVRTTQEIINCTQENNNSTREVVSDTQEIKSNRERLISLLRGNPNLTLAEIAEMIGLTRDGVKKIADKLRAEGILSREGSTKAGKWIVKLED
ncbi:MAG: winged helix-turn-helix transcriptional regulator, partial [Paramuribaculum sp.]|nr:winged helix-turn-helix transcriptional regulator [Paramuribaculum sp.]